MSNSLLRQYAAKARAQGIEFERQRVAAAVRDTRTFAEIARAIGVENPEGLFTCGEVTFDLDVATLLKHGGAVGQTGSGKSVLIRGQHLRAIRRAFRHRRTTEGVGRLGIQATFVDIKDDAGRYARALAAWYVTAAREVQDALKGSVFLDQFSPGRVPVRPLLLRHEGVNDAYLATLDVDVLMQLSNDTYSDVMRLVVTTVNRLLRAVNYPFDPYAVVEVVKNRSYRLRLIETSGVPRDVRDLLGNLEQIAAPQQIDAVCRRMFTIASSSPELAASMFQPSQFAPEARPITVADCGPESLPRSLGIARACAILIGFVLVALRRDPSVPCIALFEELLAFLQNAPNATPWFLDAWRLLRSRSTSVWWAAQSLDGLPRAFVEEVLNNMSWIVAFASRSEIADLVFPHLAIDPTDRRSDDQRRRAFARDLASFPRQHAVLWVKSQPAIRIRTSSIEEPSRRTGMPDDELDDIFRDELARGSSVSLETAERRIEEWRATHLPRRQSPPPSDRPRSSMRDLFEENA